MSRKNRNNRFDDPTAADDNPFGDLAKLRGQLPEGEPEPEDEAASAPPRFASKVVVRRERSGRGGKTVTIIQGVLMEGQAREDFVRDLRKALGTSGKVEGDLVVLGGDVVDRVAGALEEAGAGRIVIGN